LYFHGKKTTYANTPALQTNLQQLLNPASFTGLLKTSTLKDQRRTSATKRKNLFDRAPTLSYIYVGYYGREINSKLAEL